MDSFFLILKPFTMKRKFLRTFTVAIGILAMSLSLLPSVSAQTDEEVDYVSEFAPGGGGGVGCYTTHIIDCGFGLGQQLICNFTGAYGAPYQCTSHNCYGTITTRYCVLA
jgi:hypothetical protein